MKDQPAYIGEFATYITRTEAASTIRYWRAAGADFRRYTRSDGKAYVVVGDEDSCFTLTVTKENHDPC